MNSKHLFLLGTALLMATGCAVGPKFKAPVVETPAHYLGSDSTLCGERLWWKIFNDSTLLSLIDHALQHNREIGMAVSQIEQARLSLREAKSAYWPSLNYGLQAQYGNETYVGLISNKAEQAYIIRPTLSWEIDLFGKIRRSVEAQRASLFSSVESARGVQISLISEVATAYFTLLQYEYAVQVANATYLSNQQTLEMIRQSYGVGASSELDLKQAESACASAAAALPQYQRGYQQAVYALSLLLGENPTPFTAAHPSLDKQPLPEEIPVGLPSDLLARRPDIMSAYFKVAQSNAEIGVAQAMRFPSLAITGAGGTLSDDFKQLFKSHTWMWSVAGAVSGPIFSFGANKRRVQIAREANHEAILNYEQSYLQAMNDVETALSNLRHYREETAAMRALIDAVAISYNLSVESYRLGQISYLNVLDAQRTLLQAQTNYAESMASYLSSYAALYKALGGGWITPQEEQKATAVRSSRSY